MEKQSKLVKWIDDLESAIMEAPGVLASKNLVKLDKNIMLTFVQGMREALPKDIKEYGLLMERRDNILSAATAEADKLLEETKQYTVNLINENSIMQEAYASAEHVKQQALEEAQQIIDYANENSNNMTDGAVYYTITQLEGIEGIIDTFIKDFDLRYTSLLQVLSQRREEVRTNLQNMRPQETKPEAEDLEE